jgi:hypothetical protein
VRATEEARAAWRAALPAGVDANFWESVLNLVSEVLKLRLVEVYQKHKETLCILEQANGTERARMKAEKKAKAASLVEGGAERREMAIDAMELEAAELSTVLLIVAKRLLKIELRELLLQDLRPLIGRILAFVLLLVALGLLCWSYARSANLDYTLARSDGTGELGTLRQCVEHLEDGGGAGSVTDVKSTAAELAAIVERLAVLAERLQTAEEGS